MKKYLLSLTLISGFAYAQTGNFTVNPIGLLVGVASVGVDFPVGPALAVGPVVSFARVTSGEDTATSLGLGVKADIYLSNNVYNDSWVFTPFASIARATFNGSSVVGAAFGGYFGYYWFWPSGFNINLALGAQYYTGDYTSIGLADVSGVLPAGNFSIGCVF